MSCSQHAWKTAEYHQEQWKSKAFWSGADPSPTQWIQTFPREGQGVKTGSFSDVVKGAHSVWSSEQWPTPLALSLQVMILEVCRWRRTMSLLAWVCGHGYKEHITNWDCVVVQETGGQPRDTLTTALEAACVYIYTHRKYEKKVEAS